MAHVGSKTKSLGQMLEKRYVRSRDHIFSLIIMELRKSVCFDKVLNEFENGACWVKTRSLGQILEKLAYTIEATFSVR